MGLKRHLASTLQAATSIAWQSVTATFLDSASSTLEVELQMPLC